MVRPLRVAPAPQHPRFLLRGYGNLLTSGRISPHRLHRVSAARVTRTSSCADHRTPPVSSRRALPPARLFAHNTPVFTRGGSSEKPGGTVHTK